MGIKSFLIQQGFIAEDSTKEQPVKEDAPAFFPVQSSYDQSVSNTVSGSALPDPSFVAPLKQQFAETAPPDPSFVKYFEDELVKANLPGSDYFEFRQLLSKTQQKMAAKGISAPEVVLQAVLLSFEAQDIAPASLIDTARKYKEVLKQKNDDFLKGALTEKNSQLQKRQDALSAHNENLNKLQQQIKELDLQRQQLSDAVNKEKTQMEIDKSLGKEAIEKIEKAERLIAFAHDFIQSSIDTDIKRLQSV
jgi:hypothetical protein